MMDHSECTELNAMREETQKMRCPPGESVRITASFDSTGELEGEFPAGPKELTIEATNDEGELAVWFDDYWWTDLIERWGYDPVTLHLAATSAALTHPVVLHQMEMVCRVAPRWRMVGHAYRTDISSDDSIELLAASPYHEVRFIDEARPGGPALSSPGRVDLPIEELFGRIRTEQIRIGATRPVMVRLPSRSGGPEASTPATVPATIGTAAAPA